MPSHAVSLAYKISNFIRDYENEFNNRPTNTEIAEMLGVSEETVKESLYNTGLTSTISLDTPVGDESDRTLMETIVDDRGTHIDELLDRARVFDVVKQCMHLLTPREEQVLRLRFGITDISDIDALPNTLQV
jgi:RNA polymerase primary sigma factor